jgi:cytoskeletal protein CcmA (bactofilin family)
MAFFKDTVGGAREPGSPPVDALQRAPGGAAPDVARRPPERSEHRHEGRPEPVAEGKESFFAAGLTIEGKIEGAGHVRIAGRFKGDVNVQGNLTIDAGAHLAGQVRAKNIVVAGELHGNIDGADRVELLQSGLVIGDLKVGSLTVAAGSRMRGQVEFGWGDKGAPKAEQPRGNGSAA